jgi:hypothetical protein
MVVLSVLSVTCRAAGAFAPELGLKRTPGAFTCLRADNAVLRHVKWGRENNVYRPANLPHTEFIAIHFLFE